MPNHSSKTAVLLVGGHSTRMGTDKFAMNLNGQPQWEYMLAELNTFFNEVYISCRPDQMQLFEGHSLILDERTDIGPIGALYATFRQIKSKSPIFFVACDLPNFSISLSAKLHAALSDKYDVVAAFNPSRKAAEPLVAYWSRSALPIIEQFIANENYALFKCMSQLRVKGVAVSKPETLRNVNSPNQL